MTLLSPRLMLRPLTVADATERYAAWLNDPQVNRYLETRHAPQTVQSCADFIEAMNRDPDSHLFGVFHREHGNHLGNAKVGFINRQYDTAELSLFIGEKAYWKQGFGQEIVRALTAHAFGELQLERVQAGCYEDNLASLRAFLRVGYAVEGFYRRHVVLDGRRMGVFRLGMLKDEFR